MSARRVLLCLLLVAAGAGVWLWASGHLSPLAAILAADGDDAIDQLRQTILAAGAWAPLVYVLAVTVEVMVAPIPGALLYAPGGAIFGGLLGGTLSLVGNVLGAALACWLASTLGARAMAGMESPRLNRISARVRERGVLVVLLLRMNPITSSDLVSYAAGLAGVPVWRVALGTAIGMAPLCYAQAYASEWIFRVIPGSGFVLIALGIGYLAAVLWFVFRGTLSEKSDVRSQK